MISGSSLLLMMHVMKAELCCLVRELRTRGVVQSPATNCFWLGEWGSHFLVLGAVN